MGQNESSPHLHSMELGAASCQQSLFTCGNIGVDNVPAFGFQAPKGKADGSAADAAASGSCLQYCIPTQNSLAIKSTLKAKIGYCCAQGYNDFQGSIHEMVPGMSDIAIWQYDKGESQF